jgi:surface antigen
MVTSVIVGASLVVAGSPAQAAMTYLCRAKTKAEIKVCDTSGYADYMDKSWWNAYAGHNCTNYASYRMALAGVAFPGRLGNGYEWAGSARKYGFAVDTIPAVGSIGTWEGVSGINHVVYVEQVGDGWIIYSDDSYTSKVWSRIKVNVGDKWYPNRFIHFNDAAAAASAAGVPVDGSVGAIEAPSVGDGPAAVTPVSATYALATYGAKAKSKRHGQVKVTIKAANGVVPTGTVAVYKGSKKLASKPIRADHQGTVWVTLPKLKKGKHSVRVLYSGNTGIKKTWSSAKTVKIT